MRLELKKLHQNLNATIVYVTHDQIEAMTLATKVVLLDKGRIQQIGTPYDIYNKPDNIFVAKFVGSPQISLLKAQLKKVSDVWYAQIGEHMIPLNNYQFNTEPVADRKVIVGIRPEHMTQSELNSSFAAKLKVNAFEMTGSETIAEFDMGGQALRGKLEANVAIENNEYINMHCNLDNLSLFCASNECRI